MEKEKRKMAKRKHPIDNIEWLSHEELNANDYNPNVVFNQELRLLEHSIVSQGWVAPIIINTNNIIIDGFHRYMVSSKSSKIHKAHGKKVPCVRLEISDADAMCMTIRMNRARGEHIALRMADIVRTLIDVHKLTYEEISEKIGATKEEVKLLDENSIFKSRDLKNYKYSEAWKPARISKEVE